MITHHFAFSIVYTNKAIREIIQAFNIAERLPMVWLRLHFLLQLLGE